MESAVTSSEKRIPSLCSKSTKKSYKVRDLSTFECSSRNSNSHFVSCSESAS